MTGFDHMILDFWYVPLLLLLAVFVLSILLRIVLLPFAIVSNRRVRHIRRLRKVLERIEQPEYPDYCSPEYQQRERRERELWLAFKIERPAEERL